MEIFVCYHRKPAWKADLHFEFLLITFSIFAEIKSGIKFSRFHKKYRFDKKPNLSNLIQRVLSDKRRRNTTLQKATSERAAKLRRQAAPPSCAAKLRRQAATPSCDAKLRRSTTTLKVHTFQLIFADPPDSVVLHGTYFYRV